MNWVRREWFSGQENPEWRERFIRFEVMVGGTNDNPAVTFAGKRPDFHGGFGIDRQPQHRFILTRLVI